jgi:hypothetical protein
MEQGEGLSTSRDAALITMSLDTNTGDYVWENDFELESLGFTYVSTTFDRFYTSLAMSDDGLTLVVGDGDRGFNSMGDLDFVERRAFPTGVVGNGVDKTGNVIVLRYTLSAWDVQTVLYPPTVYQGQQFGASVAICDGTIVVGVPRGPSIVTDTQQLVTPESAFGHAVAFAFDNETSSWALEAMLGITETNSFTDLPRIGESVACVDGHAIVGVPRRHGEGGSLEEAGSYLIYGRATGGVWSAVAEVYAAELEAGAQFGKLINVDRETKRLFVTAPGANSNTGEVFVFGPTPTPAPTPAPTVAIPMPTPLPPGETTTGTAPVTTTARADDPRASKSGQGEGDGSLMTTIVGVVGGLLACLAVLAVIVVVRRRRRRATQLRGTGGGATSTELTATGNAGGAGGSTSRSRSRSRSHHKASTAAPAASNYSSIAAIRDGPLTYANGDLNGAVEASGDYSTLELARDDSGQAYAPVPVAGGQAYAPVPVAGGQAYTPVPPAGLSYGNVEVGPSDSDSNYRPIDGYTT